MRRLLSIFALIWLLAWAGLWASSFWISPRWTILRRDWLFYVESDTGTLRLVRASTAILDSAVPPAWHVDWHDFNLLGVLKNSVHFQAVHFSVWTEYAIPLWLPLLPGVLLLIACRRMRRRNSNAFEVVLPGSSCRV